MALCTEEILGPGFFMFFQTEECRPVSDGGIVWKKGDFYKKREPAKTYELAAEIIITLRGGRSIWEPAEAPKSLSSLHIANMILWPQSQNSFSKHETATPFIALRLNADFVITNTKGGIQYKFSSDIKLSLNSVVVGLFEKSSQVIIEKVSDELKEVIKPELIHPEARTITPHIRILANISSDIWFKNGVDNVEIIEPVLESSTIIHTAPLYMRILLDIENQFIPDYSNDEDDEILLMFVRIMRELDNY